MEAAGEDVPPVATKPRIEYDIEPEPAPEPAECETELEPVDVEVKPELVEPESVELESADEPAAALIPDDEAEPMEVDLPEHKVAELILEEYIVDDYSDFDEPMSIRMLVAPVVVQAAPAVTVAERDPTPPFEPVPEQAPKPAAEAPAPVVELLVFEAPAEPTFERTPSTGLQPELAPVLALKPAPAPSPGPEVMEPVEDASSPPFQYFGRPAYDSRE